MRHDRDVPSLSCYCGFNLRREAAPHATEGRPLRIGLPCEVSISDEKPLHMRQAAALWPPAYPPRFNLRREAAPHATLVHTCLPRLYQHCFNLRREAAPHATCRYLTG